ncbi:glycosyltransferase family 2 protein [Rhizobium deserti]|uniref:glycosyltransferase family 2 protein n=1 Tax=Rhizobium deserti TaxID=2547961 RepID=UPI001FE22070|nr:glycosyltransferase family 2 protein [Rhizobium deserti]
MDYPFKSERPDIRRGWWDKLRTAYETARITRRERRNKKPVELSPVAQVSRLGTTDIPLVFITHNDMAILPFFLRHYRQLGVTRFICVDDVSQDGTREFLAEQPDVDLWVSPIRYKEARRGRRWRETLFARYGYDRWYVNVDSDEFLFYDQCESKTLGTLITTLEKHDVKRLAAPMLDMYPGPGSIQPDAEQGFAWEFSNYFDASGYDAKLDKRGVSLKGGPRKRRFGEANELMKYPLIFWDRSCFFGSSPHRPLPYDRNFSSDWGVLLHFKFFTNYRDKITEAANAEQHHNNSQHYKAMEAELQLGELELTDKISSPFRDAQQLADLGFITSSDLN